MLGAISMNLFCFGEYIVGTISWGRGAGFAGGSPGSMPIFEEASIF